jgi:hypothetical protein
MEPLELIEGMNEAIRILKNVRLGNLTGGSLAIWCLVDHAEMHLDKQIRELLAPPVEVVAHHTKDSDCTLDPQTHECIYCRVWHGGPPCPDCGQYGYHRNLCRQLRLKSEHYAL